MSELELIPAGFTLCWIIYYLRGILRIHRSLMIRGRGPTFTEVSATHGLLSQYGARSQLHVDLHAGSLGRTPGRSRCPAREEALMLDVDF